MDRERLATLGPQLVQYLDEITADITRAKHRKWAGAYIRGLLLDGDRKSIAPIAKRVQDIDNEEGDYEQSLQQFIDQGVWDDNAVRQRIRSWIVERVGSKGTLILSHMCCVKKGAHSVGVARQRNPQTRQRDNCQIVSLLHYAVEDKLFCLDASLRLPAEWIQDPARCARAGIPDAATHMAGATLDQQLVNHQAGAFSGDVIAAAPPSDGSSRPALSGWQRRYCLGIDSEARIVDPQDPESELTVEALAHRNRRVFKQVKNSSHEGACYAKWRVQPTYQLVFGRPYKRRTTAENRRKAWLESNGQCWLLAELRGLDRAAAFYLSNHPANWSLPRLVQLVRMIQKGERANEELNQNVGFDHFEGRRWRGWQHHVTLALAAYAFWVVYQSKSG